MLGDSLRRRNPAPAARPARPPRRPPPHGRFPWLRWVLAAVIVLVVSFGIGFLLSTQLLFPAPETAGTGIQVPDLYGLDREAAEAQLVEQRLNVGTVRSQASMQVPAGQVIAQSPIAGQQLRPGGAVELTLSAGPPQLIVAAVQGLGADVAREILQDAGFQVEVARIPAQSPAGLVTGSDPGAGTTVRLPASVTLFVSSGPPQVDTSSPPPGATGGP